MKAITDASQEPPQEMPERVREGGSLLKAVEEIDEESGPIKEPFDPYQVKISTPPTTIYHIIDRLENDDIAVPAFQRAEGLWDDTKQSQLIESILLHLPLPAFYFSEEEPSKEDEVRGKAKKWQVVDGLQRVTTIKNFVVEKTLKLKDLEFLKLNGKGYNDLSLDMKRRINTFPITVYIIEAGTPDAVTYNLFSRINKGVLILAPQEIRHALNQGIPASFVQELSQMDAFKQATSNVLKTERMQDRDFATRFISFYINDYFTYTPDLDSFMSKSMAQIKVLPEVQRQKMKEDFKRAMLACIQIFGNDAFRKRFNKEDARSPINKALFEVISVTMAKLSKEDTSKLIEKKDDFKEQLIALMGDRYFVRSITAGTGQKESVIMRFQKLDTLVQNVLNHAN